jgi:hypothetical protein
LSPLLVGFSRSLSAYVSIAMPIACPRWSAATFGSTPLFVTKAGLSSTQDLEVLTIRQHRSGERHPDTLEAMNNLGLLYRSEGKSAQAEEVLSKALEIRRRFSGEEDARGNMH